MGALLTRQSTALDRGVQNQLGHWEDRNLLPLLGTEPQFLGWLANSSVTVLKPDRVESTFHAVNSE